jgi:hypothetical protein
VIDVLVAGHDIQVCCGRFLGSDLLASNNEPTRFRDGIDRGRDGPGSPLERPRSDALGPPPWRRILFRGPGSEQRQARWPDQIAEIDSILGGDSSNDEYERNDEDGHGYHELDEEPKFGHDGRSFLTGTANTTARLTG